jgi:hypothetical protein
VEYVANRRKGTFVARSTLERTPLRCSGATTRKKQKPPLSYADFRTGLTYREVYYMIWGRQYKRRHGVLGKWREIKLAMYHAYLVDRR